MGIEGYKEKLQEQYLNRDVDAIIRCVRELMKDPGFSGFYNQLCKQNKVKSASMKVDEIATALIDDVDTSVIDRNDQFATVTYFEISSELGKQFGKELEAIYLSSKMPDEFMLQVRTGHEQDESDKLSDDLVAKYRDELIKIEAGSKVVSEVLQRYSHFPAKNATTMSRLFERLDMELKANYKYLSIKAFLMSVYLNAEGVGAENHEDGDNVLFRNYLNTGQEPPIKQQVRFRLAVNTLFRHLKEQEVLPEDHFKSYVRIISRIWGYRCPSRLTPNAREILEELQALINHDLLVLRKRLARTFVDEYQNAEDRMRMYHSGIQSELAATKEYLRQLSMDRSRINSSEEEKIRIAQEKLIGLEGVFKVSSAMDRAASGKSFLELERTSLGISTSVTSERITEWIRIYSILYSNAEFLAYTDTEVDFKTMRSYISDLSTYHLILGIAQLKTVVDRSLSIPEEDKHSHFKMFNEALKKRLHNMMGSKDEEKSLSELIEDLGFLENKSLQFVIADTFEGFQKIADAFNESTSDFFVNDREALLRESRALYKQICNQCLKNFVIRPIRYEPKAELPAEEQKKSWLTRLFS